jgi:tripartite ATP-independent transporter DctM subunit
MLGLIGIPVMLEKKYDKRIISGAICASGSLGILIPPSIMIVMWGPTASISVGKLFMGAFMPGLLLSGLYIAYIYIRCLLEPSLGPAANTAEMNISLKRKLTMLAGSLVPPLLLIFSVLGSILFGVASPTEAAGVGALASLILALGYRALSLQALKNVLIATLRTIGMVMGIAFGAKMFTSLFLQLQCGDVISDLFLGIPGGKWVIFLVIMVVFFILGMFIDWMGIIFIMVPIITPLGASLGFNPIWFAIMMMVNLQFSFITPPIAYAIFFLKGILKPEWGITTNDIIMGILPYLGLIAIALILCTLFPGIILWLPSRMF